MNMPVFTPKEIDVICKALAWYADEQNSFPANLLLQRFMSSNNVALSAVDAFIVKESLQYLDKRLLEIFSNKRRDAKLVQTTQSCIRAALKTLGDPLDM